MTVQELIDQLKAEELRGVSLTGSSSSSTMSEDMTVTLLGYINSALTDLHTRFMIKEKTVLLLTRVGKNSYPLRVEYSRLNGTYDGPRHIDDLSGEPFSEDFIKISGIFDKYGRALPMNDSNDVESVFTPEFDVVQIPGVFDGDLFSVTYQVAHPTLVSSDLSARIELPRFLIAPLKLSVAAKFYAHLNGEEHSAKGMAYEVRYEAACSKIVEMDMTLKSEVVTNLKLEQRGFV